MMAFWRVVKNLKEKLSFVWLIAIACFLVFIWFAFFYFKMGDLPIFSRYESVQELSKYMPKEMTVESDAEVLRNFSRVENGGTLYSLLEFRSKNELSNSAEYYKSLLGKNGWTVKVIEDEILIKDIEGDKNGNKIIVNTHYDEQINSNVITIHFFNFSFNGE